MFVVAVCAILLLVLSSRVISSKEQRLQNSQPILFTIQKGESFSKVCKNLVKQTLITDCFGHKLENKLFGTGLKVKSGTYKIELEQHFDAVVQQFIAGKEAQFSFIILEGENVYQVLDKVGAQEYLTDDVSTLDLNSLAQKLDLPEPHPEGFLYPDTYFYTKGTTASALLKRAALKQQQTLIRLWNENNHQQILTTPYEVLILASIIEKESALKSERDIIASVFFNRLEKNMRLQTDPTVIYGVWDEYKGDITRRHLKQKTAYNTYRINGLPPTPIANPSAESIKAALDPAATDYFYFVSSGDGAHVFSQTLKEHNLAVKRYLEKTRS
ncbi:endolytic transglycosylase MltG [Psychrosphaera sp. B3R10]|nr:MULTISPECIES: endolytic transglycosylase MltG [unclassified Psychrosphaera]